MVSFFPPEDVCRINKAHILYSGKYITPKAQRNKLNYNYSDKKEEKY